MPIEHIGRDSDFFALGGHSLTAVRVVSQLQQALQLTLPLREIFSRRTVRELASYLDCLAPTAPLPAIEPVPRDGPLPFAPVQERLWVVHQMHRRQSSYNMPMALRLQGPLSLPALQAAFDALLQRHEALRTRFMIGPDGQPQQVVEPAVALDIPVRDASREDVPSLAADHAAHVFDLERAPMLNVQVLRLDPQEHVLMLNMHHIVSDGWSMNVLARDMQELYAAKLQGRPAQLPALSVQYADYAHGQRRQDMAAHAAYWAQALHGHEPGLNLPLDRPAQPGPSAARVLTLDYPAELCAELGVFCAERGLTLFMALTAALGMVLRRYSGRGDVCVGTTVAGRDRAELEPLIGFFVNIMALRLDVSGDPSSSELMERVKRTMLSAFDHQALPFEQVLQQLGLSRDSGQELVPVIVRHQNLPDSLGSQWSDELTVELLPGHEQVAKCALDLQFFGDARGMSAAVEYAADLFDEATVLRLLRHHQKVLRYMVQHPMQPLSRLQLLTTEERRMIEQANRTACELDDTLSVAALFEQQVQITPDACACVDEQGQLSYAELNVRANRIAHALRERGVDPEVRVGLYMPRSCDFIAAMLGIFKAGGVYVPLDVNAPPAYLHRLIEDAQPQVVLHGPQLPAAASGGIDLLSVADAVFQGPEWNLSVPWKAQQLAMLAYTSGSTGLPKGVLVPHGQLLNLLRSMQARLPLGPEDIVAQKTMAPFVVSMKEFLGALLSGVPQVVMGDALLKDPAAFIATLQRWRVSRLFIVPSHLQAVLDALEDPAALSSLRVCVTAGEPLSQRLCERVRRTLPWVAVWNNFGCTELNDTTYCDLQSLSGAGPFVPIGRPIDNVRVHVLDEQLHELPLGVAGELCVDYPWMARGYWRQPDLTAERFVPNPCGTPGARLYRTGDIVRRLPDGSLEYLGREDFDIKIRGQRVDVRQVEAALSGCNGVDVAAAGAWPDDRGALHLVAYVVPRQSQQPLQAAALRRQLAAQLPPFMVPSLYVTMQALPCTATGKLDRKALPAPQADALARQPYVAPQTDTERSLAAFWSELLDVPVERIGREDDFFALGGHSLLAARVAARVQQALQRPLQLNEIFACTSLRALSDHIDALPVTHRPVIARRDIQQDAPLSFPQQNLWFLDRLEPGNPAFNLSASVQLSGDIDMPALEQAFRTIIDRHEVLRTTFHHDERLLREAVAQPGVPLTRLSLLDEQERLLLQGPSAQQFFGAECCVHELFEQQAACTPQAAAVVFEGKTLSYAALNARANRLAHHLIALGVRPDTRVALALARGIDMVVAMLATLKAGGAYVPLDADYPPERLAVMLADSAPRVLLTMARIRTAIGALPDALDVLDLDNPGAWQHLPATNPRPFGLDTSHLAYVIYTSGSTGTPKAAQVAHRGLRNLLDWYVHDLGFNAEDSVLVATSPSFDLTQKNIFGPLIVGATLHLGGELFEPSRLLEQIRTYSIRCLNVAPSAFHALIDAAGENAMSSLRQVMLGGEPIQVHKLLQLHEPRPQIINNYGPTECSDVVACHVLQEPLQQYATTGVPLGKPLRNTRLYVLDAYGQPAPVGVMGEICVAGVGVGWGYLNRPELTAERFVPDPLASDPGERMYRTGDLGRWKPDGTVEFAGRNDHQVKVRGFRIELGEIEARLREHPNLREAVVLACEDATGDKRLVAYVIAGETLAPKTLREHMGALLPEYMVPAAYVQLDAWPLTPNGKLDRRALPMPHADAHVTRPYEPPRGEIEQMLAELWCEQFQLERVGRHDNFFDLGGHSLLALQMLSRASARLQRELPVRLVFTAQTIAALAREIGNPHAGQMSTLVPIRRSGSLEPLFIVHAGDGEVGYAFDLAPHLTPERPLHALAAIGFADGEVPLADVAAMASVHVRAMRGVQPLGPYHVVGWSAGGTIAYEIAAQLLEQGERVGFVGVIDTLSDYSGGQESHGRAPTEAQFLADFVREELDDHVADQLAGLAERGDIDAMLDLCQALDAIPATIERTTMRRHLAVRCAIRLAVSRCGAHADHRSARGPAR